MGVDHKMAQQYVTFTSLNYPDHAMRHCNYEGFLNEHEEDNEDFQFVMVAGLTDRRKVSFESVNFPGYFLRHKCFRMKLHERDGSELFDNDATFEMVRPNAECERDKGSSPSAPSTSQTAAFATRTSSCGSTRMTAPSSSTRTPLSTSSRPRAAS